MAAFSQDLELLQNPGGFAGNTSDKFMGSPEAMIAMGTIELNPTWREPRPEMAWAYMYASAVAQKTRPPDESAPHD